MSRNRRRLLPATIVALSAIALAVIGCSSSGGSAGNSATGSNSAAAKGTVYPLTITEPNGKKAVVPKKPTRIVVVDNAGPPAEDLAALGVLPIGGLEYNYTGTSAQIYGPLGITPLLHITSYIDLGTAPGTVDLEKLVAVHPDLIVGDQGAGTPDLAQLEAIAPVVSLDENAAPTGTGVERLPWYPEVKLLAQVLDRQPELNSFVAKFEAQAAPVQSELAGKSVTLVEPLPGSVFGIHPPDDQYSLFFSYLGMTINTGGLNTSSFSLSDELISKLAGSEYLVVIAYSPETLTMDKSLLAGPLFGRLPAVKAGRVLNSIGPTFSGIFPEGPVSELKAIPALGKAIEAAGASQ